MSAIPQPEDCRITVSINGAQHSINPFCLDAAALVEEHGPIMIDHLPEELYHQAAGISSHGLGLIARSPEHYRDSHENSRPPTAAMQKGSALHCLVLEPDSFPGRWAVDPTPPTSTGQPSQARAAKDKRAALEADGRTVLSHTDWDAIHRMAESVRVHPRASEILELGTAERSGWWFHRYGETGVLCRMRVDWYAEDIGCVVDLKTASDASYEAFWRSMLRYRYHVQAAYYVHGWEQITGTSPRWAWVVVESAPPWSVAVYDLEDRLLDVGRAIWQRDLEKYAACLEIEDWPGYDRQPGGAAIVQTIGDLPGWAYRVS